MFSEVFDYGRSVIGTGIINDDDFDISIILHCKATYAFGKISAVVVRWNDDGELRHAFSLFGNTLYYYFSLIPGEYAMLMKGAIV